MRQPTSVADARPSAFASALPVERRLRARDDLARRIRGEFEEMPGLNLTLPQAALLFGMPEPVCSHVLQQLIDARFLRRTAEGRYVTSDLSTR
jgi:hypothetical protein